MGVLEGCELRGLKRVIVLHRLVTGGKKETEIDGERKGNNFRRNNQKEIV